jgi:hypothetical protein
MVEEMLGSLASDQVVNGFTLAARPGIEFVLGDWPRAADGSLDLAQAPMRLLAIVNRFDLRNLDAGDAGEARFIFGIADGVSIREATIIVEYKLPAATEGDVRAWADRFHALGSLPFGEEYNAALEEITERFVTRGARPGAVNGSALNALRTNEISFGAEVSWELREFALSPLTGHLVPATVKLTPDRSFQLSQTLADYINANQDAILAERHDVPESFGGVPFLAGAITNNNHWFAPGVDPQARHKFALNTCNGCHSPGETRTNFVHVAPRFSGEESVLSLFLTGGFTVSDPFTFELRTFNDLARRRTDLMAVVCDDQPGAKPANLRRGISRVH